MEPTYGTPADGTPGTPDNDLRQRAVEQLNRRSSFYKSLISFAIIISMLWVIWVISALNGGSWFPWPIFPMLGWGVGIAFQARSVFAREGHSEDQIQREMRRLGGE